MTVKQDVAADVEMKEEFETEIEKSATETELTIPELTAEMKAIDLVDNVEIETQPDKTKLDIKMIYEKSLEGDVSSELDFPTCQGMEVWHAFMTSM
jgi:hypothetical protein